MLRARKACLAGHLIGFEGERSGLALRGEGQHIVETRPVAVRYRWNVILRLAYWVSRDRKGLFVDGRPVEDSLMPLTIRTKATIRPRNL